MVNNRTKSTEATQSMSKKSITEELPWTQSVPECGRQFLGLGRDASYKAARAGLIPTIAAGRKLRALPRILAARLRPKEPA
jgi:hypothetical protein